MNNIQIKDDLCFSLMACDINLRGSFVDDGVVEQATSMVKGKYLVKRQKECEVSRWQHDERWAWLHG